MYTTRTISLLEVALIANIVLEYYIVLSNVGLLYITCTLTGYMTIYTLDCRAGAWSKYALHSFHFPHGVTRVSLSS